MLGLKLSLAYQDRWARPGPDRLRFAALLDDGGESV